MENKFYTKVIASEGFWEKIFMKQLERETPFKISNKISDELIITSTGKSALDEIITLSAKYPDEVIRVKIEGDDVCNNYVYLYECSKGTSKLVNEGYEYYFKFNVSDLERIDTMVLDRFKRQTVLFFKHNEHYLPNDIAMNLNNSNNEGSDKWSVAISYETKDVQLTATKEGLTCLNIEVEFADYEPLPF